MHYNHNVQTWTLKSSMSIALDVPTYEALVGTAIIYTSRHCGAPTISFKAGLAKVHPKDRFNKKIGFKLSQEKMQYEEFVVEYVIASKDRVLVSISKEGWPSFNLAAYYDSKTVKLFR